MFYLTLPSNSSMVFFPDNNASHFFTMLPQPQELDGEYEVGLAEIQFTNSYQNVRENTVYFEYEEDYDIHPSDRHRVLSNSSCKRVDVPAGLYDSNKSFITTLNEVASEYLAAAYGEPMGTPVIRFDYSQATRRACVHLLKQRVRTVLRLSPTLTEILAMPTNELKGEGKFSGQHAMDLDKNVKSIFVYTDLVQPRPVGDVVVPLLRTLPPVKKELDTVHYLFEKPHYIPLSRFQFETVEILLTSDRGEPIPFDQNAHTIVTLHFRRRRLV